MKVTHVTLAFVSGAMLILIMSVVFRANMQRSPGGVSEEEQVLPPVQQTQTTEAPSAVNNVSFPERSTSGKILDLHGKGLVKVPAYVFSRKDIETLNVSNNKLEGSLQAEVRQLSNLVVLNLSHNLFTGVPAEVGQLTNLEVLDLSYNKLTGLPYEIGNLQHLRVLDLRGNVYTQQDLERIRSQLPVTTEILID